MDTEIKQLFLKILEDRKQWYREQSLTCPKVHQAGYRSASTAYSDVLEMCDYLFANDKANLETYDYFGDE